MAILEVTIMTLIPPIIVISQDAPHHVAADGKMPGKRPDRPALPGFHDNQPLLELFPVLDKDGHLGSS
jgi:hypothetical protein